MKRIAIFHPSSELYGADRIMVIAAKALKDYQPIIYLPSCGVLKSFIQQEIPQAIVEIVPEMPIISRGMFNPKGLFNFLKDYRWFKNFIKRETEHYEFDCAYVNTLACSFLLPGLSELNIPVFTHVHEILERPKPVAMLTAKIAFKYSDKVISVSKAVQDNLHRYVKQSAKSMVVHNGISPILAESQQKHPQLSFYLFGRIKPEKGQWYLLEALKNIPKHELENTEFNLVGDTLKGKEELKLALVKKIQEYQLENVVKLHGFKSDITSEMEKATVCLVPSLMKDPFPTTVLEAMSAGKVVIATDTGGAKEAIDNGKNGFIIPANNPQAFAKTIRDLLNNPPMIQPIGQKAKQTFEERFTVDGFNLRWIKALKLS